MILSEIWFDSKGGNTGAWMEEMVHIIFQLFGPARYKCHQRIWILQTRNTAKEWFSYSYSSSTHSFEFGLLISFCSIKRLKRKMCIRLKKIVYRNYFNKFYWRIGAYQSFFCWKVLLKVTKLGLHIFVQSAIKLYNHVIV